MKLLLFAAIFYLLTLSSCKKDFSTEGLLLYYSFDGNLSDKSPYRNNGIDHTSGKYVEGKWGKALDFDGKNDYIQLPSTLNPGSGLSFSFWINTRGAASGENNGVIVSKYNMTGHKRSFMIYSFGANETRSDNRLSAVFYQGGIYPMVKHDHVKSYMEPEDLSIFPDPKLWTIVNPVRLTTSEWTHCAINTTSTSIGIWINGELCVKKQREYDTYSDTMDEPTYIGNILSGGDGSNNHFNGALDELRIFGRELTIKEIQSFYRDK